MQKIVIRQLGAGKQGQAETLSNELSVIFSSSRPPMPFGTETAPVRTPLVAILGFQRTWFSFLEAEIPVG
ncbi:hypothetical protein Hypma_016549 [Hypsizygus marmoreus]|uniref:Uncharacterized protein n=1 Tax=Hypsizygus marmoreus TaxID=39966 RepID=A0A369J2V0_HYPMA|nr:hypothetical protein Hypma_016549 [Hypsizygus marmoreus]